MASTFLPGSSSYRDFFLRFRFPSRRRASYRRSGRARVTIIDESCDVDVGTTRVRKVSGERSGGRGLKVAAFYARRTDSCFGGRTVKRQTSRIESRSWVRTVDERGLLHLRLDHVQRHLVVRVGGGMGGRKNVCEECTRRMRDPSRGPLGWFVVYSTCEQRIRSRIRFNKATTCRR